MKHVKQKVALVGYLGYAVKEPIIGGQMNKTRGILRELEKHFEMIAIDTSNWKREMFPLLKKCLLAAKECDTVIIMPNKNGIKLILPLFAVFKNILGYRLAYPVVGGWITNLLEKHCFLRYCIRKVDYILPETEALAAELRKNVQCKMDVMPVFSTRSPIDSEMLASAWGVPLEFCTFSRVTPQKGVDEAVHAVRMVNEECGRLCCRLDVWGPVEEGLEDHYAELFRENADCVNYMGILSGDELWKLSRYCMMLFLTSYPGEGFPITICESYMAGLPVIASDWRFNSELVDENVTGFIVHVHDLAACVEKMKYCIGAPEQVRQMHSACLKKSESFQPEQVIKNLSDWVVARE